MIKVEIKNDCSRCVDLAMDFGIESSCDNCPKTYGDLITFVSGFWGTYGIVALEDGKVKKIPINELKVLKGKE